LKDYFLKNSNFLTNIFKPSFSAPSSQRMKLKGKPFPMDVVNWSDLDEATLAHMIPGAMFLVMM
jgi:hypothetical protein